MQIRYTALDDLNTADHQVSVYDFGGNAGAFQSSAAYIDREDPMVFSVAAYISTLSASPQKVFGGAFFDVFAYEDKVRVYLRGDATNDDFTTLVPIAGRENFFTFRWGADGTYSITLNNSTEAETAGIYTASSEYIYLGSASDPLDGWITNATLEVNGALYGAWAGTDGAGTVFADSVGSEDLNLTGTGSPAPTGWITHTPAHFANVVYTIPVALKGYDRSRNPIDHVTKSLSGVQRTTTDRQEVIWACKTTPVAGADFRNLREFLTSSLSGQRFEFDDGNGFVWCILQGTYREERAVMRGDGGAGDSFSISWKHREVY